MEFWLSQDGGEELQLPVPPPNFKIKTGNLNSTVTVENVGEINLIGKSKLATIDISSFFPSKQYKFCKYKDFPSPWQCVGLIENWRKSGKPIRLKITETSINSLFSIEDFEAGEDNGSGDVSFTLNLKEYKIIESSSENTTSDDINLTANTVRPTKEIPTTYTVQEGDTLWSIAQNLLGDGNKSSELSSKNGIANPNKLEAGQVLEL